MTKDDIKKKLDCTARMTGNELVKSALNLITEQENEIILLQAKNIQLTEQLKRVLLSVDTVKEMNLMCNIYKQQKDAVQDFAEWVKDHIADVPFCNQKAYNIFCDMVNKKLKEYNDE